LGYHIGRVHNPIHQARHIGPNQLADRHPPQHYDSRRRRQQSGLPGANAEGPEGCRGDVERQCCIHRRSHRDIHLKVKTVVEESARLDASDEAKSRDYDQRDDGDYLIGPVVLPALYLVEMHTDKISHAKHIGESNYYYRPSLESSGYAVDPPMRNEKLEDHKQPEEERDFKRYFLAHIYPLLNPI